MSDDVPLVVRQQRRATDEWAICLVSFRTLQRRCHTLGITQHDLLQCALIADLQKLAKRRYHVLAKRFHPDSDVRQIRNGRNGARLTGFTFRRITETYKWMQGLPGWQAIHPWYWADVPETALPLTLERWDQDLGYGWNYDVAV